MDERAYRLSAAGTLILACLMLAWALLGSPPYAFFGLMKFVVAGAGSYAAVVLFRLHPATVTLIIPMGALCFVELTGKMRRVEWVPWNWATIAVFLLAAVILVSLARPRQH